MSLKFRKCFLTTALLIYFARDTSPAADQVLLQFNPAGLQGEVALRSNMGLPVSAMYPEFTIWRSTNLQTWQPFSSPISGHAGVSDEFLRVAVPLAGDRAFYRVVANIKLAPAGQRVGDAVYGYGTEFARQLQLTGQLSLSDFVSRYLTNQYLSQVSFDPTTAEFWDQFNLDTAVHNATNSTDPRLTNFRLGTNEFAVFQTNGFVVSPARHGSLHQAALYRADSVLVPGWVRRAAPRFLAKDEGNGATDRGTGENPAEVRSARVRADGFFGH